MFRYLFLTLASLGLGSVTLSVFHPAWAVKYGLDVWNLPDLQRELAEHQRLAEELAERDQCILERSAAKQEILGELLAERLTLLEAAAWFRRVTLDSPESSRSQFLSYPGKTENECYCRQVLKWLKVEVMDMEPTQAVQAEALYRRLTAELDAQLANHNGAVMLPDIRGRWNRDAIGRRVGK